MILIGMGANLPSPKHGSPVQTLEACLQAMEKTGLKIINKSRWYESAPVPISDQPWYVNGVIEIHTSLSPLDLLKSLLSIEESFGRVRFETNAPRVLDLDLIAYNDVLDEDTNSDEEKPFCVPHPRLHERAFVLLPIRDLNPDWKHPKSKKSLNKMIEFIPKDQIIRPIME